MSTQTEIQTRLEMNRYGHPVEQKKQATLVLKTGLGRNTYRGIPKGRFGMKKFGFLVRKIWEASSKDDPYADLFLMRIYDLTVKVRNKLRAISAEHEGLLKQHPGMLLDVCLTEKPYTVPLYYGTPYAFIAAHMVADFDRVVQVMVAVRHFGLLESRFVTQKISDARSLVYQVLAMPFRWHETGITRQDIFLNKPLAEEAKKRMGNLPEPVLSRAAVPPFHPGF